jgi:pyrimidine deaminase RibD-like protein
MANGAGLARLKTAGIAVDLGVLRAESRAMNADFFARL